MRLTNQKWDNLKFNKDKNVSGLKSIKYVKIHEFVIRVSVNVFLCENPKEMKKKDYYNIQDSGYFWKEGGATIRKGYMRASGVLGKVFFL